MHTTACASHIRWGALERGTRDAHPSGDGRPQPFPWHRRYESTTADVAVIRLHRVMRVPAPQTAASHCAAQ
eukprot:scaffold265137_cov40-Tisochrysis_lutea.AAC.1